jgi:hypothetical protein
MTGLAAQFVLTIWLAIAPPAVPQKFFFGPFYSFDECERAYAQGAQRYIGAIPMQHDCKIRGET